MQRCNMWAVVLKRKKVNDAKGTRTLELGAGAAGDWRLSEFSVATKEADAITRQKETVTQDTPAYPCRKTNPNLPVVELVPGST